METTQATIGIKKDNRKAVVAMLGKLLADEYLLYTKLRNAHWNVEGIDFHTKHVFLNEFLKLSHLKDESPKKNDSSSFMEVLLEDHETIIKFIRKSISENAEEHNDEGTADFITGIMQLHEQMSWMLRASLKTFK